MSLFWIIYLSIGVYHFGKQMNNLMEGEPPDTFDMLNVLAWCVIVIFAGLLWPLIIVVNYFKDGNVDYLWNEGFRII